MAIRDLIPWKKPEGTLLRGREEHPLVTLRHEMDRLFEDFVSGCQGPLERLVGRGEFVPKVDVKETEKEVRIVAELPGMTEDDIHVELTAQGLSIRGEKKAEKEEKREGYCRSERSYGSFERFIPIPLKVESDKASAEFKNGLLTVTLPKAPEEQTKRKKIEVKSK